MTTHDLAETIATDSGLTKVQADVALNSLASSLAKALRNNEEVYISGIGTFSTSRIPVDTENAQTGKIQGNLDTARIPHFEPGNDLLTAVR